MQEYCDENLVSPSDYTIKIMNLPRKQYTQDDIE